MSKKSPKSKTTENMTLSSKKRKLDNADISSKTPDKKKPKPEDFTAVEFLFKIKDEDTAFDGLARFSDQIKLQDDKKTDYDIVSEYCVAGNDVKMIVQLIESGKRNNKQLNLILDCLQVFLHRFLSDLPKYKPLGNTIVNCLLSSSVPSISYQLSVKNKSLHVKVALKLLTAMVRHGGWAAASVLKSFNFDQVNIKQLLNCKDLFDDVDVKMCLTHLIVALLSCADKSVVKDLLAFRAFWSSLFGYLHGDKAQVIVSLLHTIQTKIVSNIDVSKTTKIHLFNEQALRDLVGLYSWTGPKRWNETSAPKQDHASKKNKKQHQEFTPLDFDALTSDQLLVREVTHELLTAVCCSSSKLGINFVDKVFSVTENNNMMLTSLLSTLKHQQQNQKDPLKAELMYAILRAAPDQLYHFLPTYCQSCTPRPTQAWLDTVRFLHKIYSCQPLITPALKLRSTVPAATLVSMVMTTVLPHRDIWIHFTAAIKKPWSSVVHESLSFMAIILSRFEAVLAEVEASGSVHSKSDGSQGCDSANHNKCSLDDSTQKEDKLFCVLLREAVVAAFPDVQTIFECWTNATSVSQSQSSVLLKMNANDEKMSKKAKKDADITDNLPVVPLTDRLTVILQVLCSYSTLTPVLSMEHAVGVDFSSLLDGVLRAEEGNASAMDTDLEMSLSEGSRSLLRHNVLKLLATSNVRLADLLAVTSEGRPCALKSLLNMASVDRQNESVSTSTLITKILMNCGLFTNAAEEELKVWLDHMTRVELSYRPIIISFLVSCIDELLRDPYMWTERIAHASTRASSESLHDEHSMNDTRTDWDKQLAAIIAADKVSLLEDDFKSTQNSCSTDRLRFSFTALFPIALENVKLSNDHNIISSYLDNVAVDILHLQCDPATFCVMLNDSKLVLNDTKKLADRCMSREIKSTDVGKRTNEIFTSPRELLKNEIMSLFLNVTQDSSEEKLLSATSLIPQMSLDDCLAVTRNILFYIGVEIRQRKMNGLKIDCRISIYVDILQKVVDHSWTLTENLPTSTVQSASEDLTTDVEQRENELAAQIEKEKKNIRKTFLKIYHLIFHHQAIVSEIVKASALAQRFAKVAGDAIRRIPDASNSLFDEFSAIIEARVNDTDFSDTAHDLTTVKEFMPIFKDSTLIHIAKVLLHQRSLMTREIPQTEKKRKSMSPVKSNKKLKHTLADSLQLVVEAVNHLCELGILSVTTFSPTDIQTLFDSAVNVNGTSDACLSSVHKLLIRLLDIDVSFGSHATSGMIVKLMDIEMTSSLELVSKLIRSDSSVFIHLINWCTNHNNWRCPETWEKYWSLIKDALQLSSNDPDDTLVLVVYEAYWHPLLTKLCDKTFLEMDIVKQCLVTDLLSLLSQHAVLAGDIDDCWKQISTRIKDNNLLSTSHCIFFNDLLRQLITISHGRKKWQKVKKDSEKKAKKYQLLDRIEEFVFVCTQGLINHQSNVTESAQEICKILIINSRKVMANNGVNSASLQKLLAPSVWSSLVRSGLKYRFEDDNFLQLLSDLINVLYRKEEEAEEKKDEDNNLLPLSKIHSMIFSHSLFMATLLSAGESKNKDALVSLLLAITRFEPSCCQLSHVPLLMGAYNATMSPTDMNLLLLLELYDTDESSESSIFEPYLWGKKAIDYHANKKSVGSSLLRDTSLTPVLDLIDKELMLKSALNFPLQRRLMGAPIATVSSFKVSQECYDPAFLFPVFNALLDTHCSVDCVKFVEHHCLEFVLCALSSHVLTVRTSAYRILAQFNDHLELASGGVGANLTNLLTVLRNSSDTPNAKLPCIWTVFLARAVQILVSPADDMFIAISHFLNVKPAFDFKTVPEFYKLFFCAKPLEYKLQRTFILNILTDGLRETGDYHVCEHSYVYKNVMSFHTSPLSDHHSQLQILKFLTKSCSIRKIALDLIENHALLAWIGFVSLNKTGTAVQQASIGCALVAMLSTLWSTLMELYIKKGGQQTSAFTCLPAMVLGEILLTLRKVEQNIGYISGAKARKTLKELITAAVDHSRVVSQQYTARGRFNPIPSLLCEPAL